MNLKPIVPTLGVLCAFLVLSSCDRSGEGYVRPGKRISFNVSETTPWSQGGAVTKSAVSEENYLLISEQGGDTLCMSLSVGDYLAYGDVPQTKGAPVTTATLADISPLGIRAYDRNGSFFDEGETLVFNDTRWATSKAYPWPEGRDRNVDFYSWAPLSFSDGGITGMSVDNNSKTMSFAYSMPSADAASGQDAVNQSDMLLCYMRSYPGEFSGGIPLKYSHALSAVRFLVGNTPAITIKSVAIEGAIASASCLFQPNESEAIVWTPSGATATYTQTFDVAYNENTTGESQDLTDKDGHVERTFMLIPQDINGSGDVTFVLTFLENGKELVYRAAVPAINWAPGKVYTYRFNMNKPFISVSVDDQVIVDTKSSLVIKNTGNILGFVRAAIVANWYNESGEIVGGWDESQGVFTGLPGEGWVKGSDGFYYYTSAVAKGAQTGSPLFVSYTRPTRQDAHLEMSVITQIIDARGQSDCMGAYAAL